MRHLGLIGGLAEPHGRAVGAERRSRASVALGWRDTGRSASRNPGQGALSLPERSREFRTWRGQGRRRGGLLRRDDVRLVDTGFGFPEIDIAGRDRHFRVRC